MKSGTSARGNPARIEYLKVQNFRALKDVEFKVFNGPANDPAGRPRLPQNSQSRPVKILSPTVMAVTEVGAHYPKIRSMEPMEAKMFSQTATIAGSMVFVWSIFLFYMAIA